ncbi:MAG: uroporphyrinogen-III C-methyltransferase [Proteobacteria bacterium]|nr:uroporphyrinogen-III C-methyltransferase [Pseudomonadota bacterium]
MQPDREPGRVLLVGAGPGPADLLTLRALRAIEGAGALLYDALVDETVVALAPAGCVRIQTGKRAGAASMPQETINRLMLRLARRGLTVVRLKGGDPSVFGRSGEEAEHLRAHGVPVEVVPGVTAACAAAAQFGFPLTHRGESRRLIFATARTADCEVTGDGWPSAADPGATLALYMGRDSLGAVARRLIAEGRAPTTPAAAVENAGAAHARLWTGTLATLPARLAEAAPEGPVMIVIGDVAAQADAQSGHVAADQAFRAAQSRG